MKVFAASAFALAMLIGVGGASACQFHQLSMASATPPAAQSTAKATVKEMVLTYLRELRDEHRIA